MILAKMVASNIELPLKKIYANLEGLEVHLMHFWKKENEEFLRGAPGAARAGRKMSQILIKYIKSFSVLQH
jgi:hypothetical protein